MNKKAILALVGSITFHLSLVAIVLYTPLSQAVSVAPLQASEQSISIRLVHEVAKENQKPEPKIEPEQVSPRKAVKKVPKKTAPKKEIKKRKVEQKPEQQEQATSKRAAVSKAPIKADILLEAERSKAKLDYTSLIVGLIAKKKRYPTRAQRLQLEGEVGLFLSVSRDGELVTSEIRTPSKHSCFNSEVIRMVKAAAPFPKAPASFYGSKLSIDIPVQFELNR